MAMRFFDHQASARSRSRRLTLAFALAVAATVAGTHLALALPWMLVRAATGMTIAYPAAFLPVNVGVALLLILGGWWIESGHTRHGVHLAERLGARRAQGDTRADERRLLDVVEEVRIAAQMPRPAVMVLTRHAGINAFATGTAPANWAVTVTDGALACLTRAELQGLVAHECSHLVEGDTALNMRLLGMVAGLEMIWGFGESLRPELDERGQASGGLGALGAVFGTLLMGVGYIGWLLGHALQAAVAREREFLADARAVQWTRQADGIGGVLRKAMTQQLAARREDAGDADFALPGSAASHLRRASALLLLAEDGRWPRPDAPRARAGMGEWLRSHPPLAERVRRIYQRPRSPLPLPRIDPRTGEAAVGDVSGGF